MRKSNRLRSKLLPGQQDIIPDDLPAPSTSRPLPPRSRTTSLARSGSQSISRHGSRGRSRSNSSRKSLAMGENMTAGLDSDMTDNGLVVSGLEPVATSSSSLMNMDEDNEAGGSSSSSVLKRKRSGSDIVVQDVNYPTTLSALLFLFSNVPLLT